MSQCVRGSLVFWLLMMTFVGAFLCASSNASENVESEDVLKRNGRNNGEPLDSPTNIAWKDWLLVEDTQPSPSDTNPGLLVRRITPKSVFVAPSFSGCSEGYRQDGMGRCVKLVKVNQAAQLDFLLQKLNAMYGSSSSNDKNKNSNQENPGPFHVSLPLGGLENNNNNKNPNDKKNQTTTTSTIMKSTTEKIKETSSSSSNNNNYNSNNNNDSNSEILIKKTELLHNTNLPITITQSSQITTPLEPQQNYNTANNNNNLETTTNIFNTDTEDNLSTTTYRLPVEENQQQQILSQNNFDSTVKREPQNNNNSNNYYENEDLGNNTKHPFVIIVPNSTYRPYDSTREDNFNTNSDDTISFIGYDSSTTTTDKGIPTTTDSTIQDTTSTIFNSNPDTTMETVTTNDGFTTILSTTAQKTTTLSNDEQQSSYTTTTETPNESSNFETLYEDINSSTYFNTHTTTTTIPYTSSVDEQENENIDEEGIIDEEGEEDVDGGDVDKLTIFGAVIQENTNVNKFIREPPSRIPSTKIPGLPLVPIDVPKNVRTKCTVTESSYGSPNINCEPEITRPTVTYPVGTTTPKPLQPSYFVKFPVDTMNLSPSSSINSGYKKTNSYIRFPEQSSSASASSMYASSSYGTKLWNADSASVSSTMWYPPASWFQFLQPQRTWSHDYNNNNNHRNKPSQLQPMSTIYHKQYHPHVLPQNVPSWISNRPSHSGWSQRD